MTYQIYFIPKGAPEDSRGHTLFDIEYFLIHGERDKDKWFSDISCLPIVEGIAYFLKDAFADTNFNLEEFIKDANDIQEFRGCLFEYFYNKPKPMEEAHYFHYNVFGKILKEAVNSFAEKYGLYVNID